MLPVLLRGTDTHGLLRATHWAHGSPPSHLILRRWHDVHARDIYLPLFIRLTGDGPAATLSGTASCGRTSTWMKLLGLLSVRMLGVPDRLRALFRRPPTARGDALVAEALSSRGLDILTVCSESWRDARNTSF